MMKIYQLCSLLLKIIMLILLFLFASVNCLRYLIEFRFDQSFKDQQTQWSMDAAFEVIPLALKTISGVESVTDMSVGVDVVRGVTEIMLQVNGVDERKIKLSITERVIMLEHFYPISEIFLETITTWLG
jgi:hypothetical protein